ncbi:MAG TPA: Crp/Fnr family transcriptional regulator [Candidatus Elarobacter sp.]|nr:Crp/Fnr family transcriptional regulator [Candidatus Elarobacter sp.]
MGFRSGNRILDALPAADAERLAPHARVLSLERGQPTTQHDMVMRCVDFPLTALMSVSGTLENGTTFELASVGPEGFVEIDAALDSKLALRSASCQFPGDVVRMPLEQFQAALEYSRPFARLARRAVRARVFVTEQSEMCNLRHTIVERLARWLLVARERLGRDDFPVTHEFLATILGTRRAGVSEAAAVLQDRGAIVYQRGNVAIGGLEQLAAASCECYEACRAAIEETFASGGER